MIALVRKNLSCLILKHNSPLLSRSPVTVSLSLHPLSALRESHTVLDILLHKYDFSPELASRVASELSYLKNPDKNADSMLSFLKESGFSNTHLVKIVKYRPRILAANLDDSIKPKIKIFQDVGFSSDDILRIISNSPSILNLSVNNNIIPSLSVLKGLLGSNDVVARVLGRSPWLLTANLDKTVVPNVEFLKSFGIPMERIRIILDAYPSSFVLKPEVVRKSAEKVKKMGLDSSSKMFMYAIRTIAPMSNEAWELKLKAFRDLGFSDSDILTMFKKAPQVFAGSVDKIKKVKELLLATGKFNMSCIVHNPSSLKFSIEKRYKPRLRILGILESRNLIKRWPTLHSFIMLSDDRFFKKFVSPHLNEVNDM